MNAYLALSQQWVSHPWFGTFHGIEQLQPNNTSHSLGQEAHVADVQKCLGLSKWSFEKKWLSNQLKEVKQFRAALKGNKTIFNVFSKHTYIVLAWIMMLSQWTSLSGSFGRLLKDLAACRASWEDAASPPPPCQLKTTHRPDSLPRTRSTEVICTRKVNQKSNHMPADHQPCQ